MELDDNKTLSELPDERLLHYYREGQDAAFEIIVERYRQELFNYLARLISNATAAEDVFQDTFLQVHLSIDRFDTDRRFRPWLFTIATNKGRDYLRRNKKHGAVSLSAEFGKDQRYAYVDLMETDVPIPLEGAQQAESRQMVRETVELLPDALREVLLLAYFHQFTYKQIAQMLNVPLGTVKSRLHAAVGSFAKQWNRRFDGQAERP